MRVLYLFCREMWLALAALLGVAGAWTAPPPHCAARWRSRSHTVRHVQTQACAAAPSPPPPPPKLPPLPSRAAAAATAELAETSFREWMGRTTPPGGAERNYTLVSSEARTMEAALADIWTEICYALDANNSSAPSLSIILLPGVAELRQLERMDALINHLKSCRTCCTRFGTELRLGSIHPAQESSSSTPRPERCPCPTLTLSSRIVPTRLRPEGTEAEFVMDEGAPAFPDGGESGEGLSQIRLDLENILLQPSATGAQGDDEPPAPLPPATEVLSRALNWVEVFFARVHKAMGSRQRRVVDVGTSAEEVFRAIWEEAAALREAGERPPPAAAATVQQPSGGGDAYGSLLVSSHTRIPHSTH